MNVVDFVDQNAKVNEKGRRWSLSAHQRRVLELAFKRDPSGRLAYRIILLSEPKKSGKSFLAACILIWWAITNAYTEIIVAANDEEQATSRVFRTAAALIKLNPELAASAQVLTTEIRFTNGTLVTAIASDYKGAAGSRHSLVVFDELWGYSTENLTRLYEELTPPPTEPNAFMLIVTYAGFEGESELLQNLYNRGLKGKRVDRTLECYKADQLFMFWSHKPRQPWQLGKEGKRYYDEQRRILRPNTFARLHKNQWVSAEAVFISAELWDAIVDESLTPVLAGAQLFVGLDIGIKLDCSARVAVRWHEDRKRLVIASHRIWKPSKGQQVQLADVQDDLLELARLNTVAKLYADPSQAMHLLQSLQPVLGESVACEFVQSIPNTTQMGEALFSLVSNKNLISYHSPELKTHVTNAVGVETPRGVRMVKSTASKKIDAGIALAMASVAAIQAGPGGTLDDIATAGERAVSDYSWWREFGDSTSPGKFWDS